MADSYETELARWAEAERAAGGSESERFLRYRRALSALGSNLEAQRVLARLSYLRVVDGGRDKPADERR